MPNSGKIWDLKEVYNKERNSSWSKGDIGVSTNTTGPTVEKFKYLQQVMLLLSVTYQLQVMKMEELWQEIKQDY